MSWTPHPKPLEETNLALAESMWEFFAYNKQRQAYGLPRLICDSSKSRLFVSPKDARNAPKIGRNSACPCGSTNDNGKPQKFKRCCGRWD